MADQDLQISGRPGHPDPEIRGKGGGGGAVSKKIFSALRASVWSKNKWGGGGGPGPSPGSLDPPLEHSRIGHYREYPPDV